MELGAQAPDFTAQASIGEEIKNDFKLSDVYKDNIVVLAFYPLDFTPG